MRTASLNYYENALLSRTEASKMYKISVVQSMPDHRRSGLEPFSASTSWTSSYGTVVRRRLFVLLGVQTTVVSIHDTFG
jgi:hypothetical protein